MPRLVRLQVYGDERQLEVTTDLPDVVQLVINNGVLIQYIYLYTNDVPRLICQLRVWMTP